MSWLGDALNGLGIGAPVLLVAVSLATLVASLRVLNVAIGGIVVLGELGAIAGAHYGLAGCILLSVALTVAATVAMELLVLHPQRSRVRDVEMGSFAATLGIGFALTALAAYLTSSNTVTLPSNFGHFTTTFTVGSSTVATKGLVFFGIAAALAVAWGRVLRDTRSGRAFRAVAANRELARQLGVNIRRVAIEASIASGALAGIAAVMIILDSRSTNAYTGSSFLLLPFVAVIVGGLGSTRAAAIAAVVIGIVEGILPPFISSPGLQDVVIFGLLFAVLVVRPTGIVRQAFLAREF